MGKSLQVYKKEREGEQIVGGIRKIKSFSRELSAIRIDGLCGSLFV
jgi:hypothetical protein